MHHSRTHKAQRPPDQVQGPMSPLPVHVGIEGFGKGGQVEAEFTSGYVNTTREKNVGSSGEVGAFGGDLEIFTEG